MKLKFILIYSCLFFFQTLAEAGGPWPKAKGEGYAQFAFYAIPSINRLSINAYRTKFLNRAVFDATGELYVEYGLTKRLTLSASIPMKIVSTGKNVIPADSSLLNGNNIGPPGDVLESGLLVDLSNISLAAKYNFLSKKVYMSGHVRISAPTAIQAYNPNTALRTAYPCWSFMPSLSIGYSKKKFYLAFETGMNFRTHNFSHQWVANFEYGWPLNKKAERPTYFALALDAILCLPGGANVPNSNEDIQTGLYVNNQNYVAITFKVLIPATEHIGINLSLSGGIWANNVQQGPNIGVGVYYKWKPKEKKVE